MGNLHNQRERKWNNKRRSRQQAPPHMTRNIKRCKNFIRSFLPCSLLSFFLQQNHNCINKIQHMMHRSSLAKKLKPAKRAWKSFTNRLQSKLHSLKIPKTIKINTQKFLTFCSHHLFIPFKKRFLTKPFYRGSHHQYNHLYNQSQFQKNFSVIYIDHLYAEPLSEAHAHAETRTGKEVVEEKVLPRNENMNPYSVEDAWNAVIAKSPQLRSVDERAEEFIYKFREDIKIQRERSLLEFQEMLARSA